MTTFFVWYFRNSIIVPINKLKFLIDIFRMIFNIQKECAWIELYLGFIGYKDFNDLDLGEEYINIDFTTDYEYIRKNIEFVKAQGGGDISEDL